MLMFVVGALVWANLEPLVYSSNSNSMELTRNTYGWPFLARTVVSDGYRRWDVKELAANLVCAVAVLAAVGVLLEFLARRRRGKTYVSESTSVASRSKYSLLGLHAISWILAIAVASSCCVMPAKTGPY